jgi:hypothetical protein
MQLTFSAATAGSVGRAQTRMCAAGLLTNGAYGIADGADRIDLFPHRSFRGTQLKVALERARANKGYDKDRDRGAAERAAGSAHRHDAAVHGCNGGRR